MRIAYLDCASGISGDMTLGALVDAGADLDVIHAGIATLGLPPEVKIVAQEVKKRGFRATQITVEHQPQKHHRHLRDITTMIDGSSLATRQKELATRIFNRLAEAEAQVHGLSLQMVHFHEVGAIDSIADIVGAAIAFDLLGIERIICSPVPTGSGFVQIAHGRCSIPAPATAELLKGVPIAPSNITSELTTPTGAAIIAALATSFGSLPPMTVERIGYGAGQRDLAEQANILRVLIGESTASEFARDQVWLLETNLDDTSGELIGHAIAKLWEAGALDVYTTAIGMKKNRPGVMLSVLCDRGQLQILEQILFRETTTLGIRRQECSRSKLRRESLAVATPWGQVAGVVAWLGEIARFSPEFESCRQIAEEHKVPLRTVYEAALRAWQAS